MVNIVNRRSLMVLYSDNDSPIGHAVRIVLAEKDVNVEINYIAGDGDRPEELNELNPYNSVMTLIDRDLVLYDAHIIMEYLDERFPHPPLMPVDPVARADNRLLRYRIMCDLYAAVDEFEGTNDIAAAGAKKELRDHLTTIAPAFSQLPFLMSEEYTLADCCIAPLLWRLSKYGIKLPAATKPLQHYANRLFGRAAFQQSLSPVEEEFNEPLKKALGK